jgi:branched-chain amino acid transport system substrate-binding protein
MSNTANDFLMNRMYWILSLVFFGLSQLIAQTDLAENPKSVLDLPVEFSGWLRDTTNLSLIDEVRIGLFLPKDIENESTQTLNQAANLAIEEINNTGGYQGLPFRMISRWSTKPWESGSKEIIKLVYQDSVLAVVGSIDGDATHIAEQIVTKAWLPLLSPISSDPTLTYIRIPWIFRLPPDYKAQSQVLIKESMAYIQLKNIGMITENNHDGRIFAEDIKECMGKNEISPGFHFQVSPSDLDFNSLVQRILSFSPNSIIICLSADNIIKLLAELGNHANHINILMPWVPELNCSELPQYYPGDIYCIEPFLRSSNPTYKEFESKFKKSYKLEPSFGAAYTYDAIYLIAKAINKNGLSRTGLRDAISEIKDFQGVTGKINWDNGGGNLARPVLRILKKRGKK